MVQTIQELQEEGLTLEIVKLFPRQGEWTEEDYFSLPETNKIVELSEGRLIITPSPTTKHQKVLFRLTLLMGNYVMANNLGEAVTSPMDVRLWEGKIREPDLVFMSNEHRDRIANECWGVPDLVMEILSEGTKKQDLDDKFGEYEKAGVQEYWIVDPFTQTIKVFTLENEVYVLFGKWDACEIAHSKLLTGFQAAIDSVFE